ncbi:hypothetical protein [Roseibium sediminis]|uniref:hypothetical protein n=1 Tax=Roseibium sediminis TaxID=1775174 RepID=UPI00123D216C|nr:hypothetical protein [Roseibium sediminis]
MAARQKQIVTLENAEKCLDTLARLVTGPCPHLLPVYERMEQIAERCRTNNDILSRARARLADQKANATR